VSDGGEPSESATSPDRCLPLTAGTNCSPQRRRQQGVRSLQDKYQYSTIRYLELDPQEDCYLGEVECHGPAFIRRLELARSAAARVIPTSNTHVIAGMQLQELAPNRTHQQEQVTIQQRSSTTPNYILCVSSKSYHPPASRLSHINHCCVLYEATKSSGFAQRQLRVRSEHQSKLAQMRF